MKEISCTYCKLKFYRKKSQILLAKNHYCSIRCQNLGKVKGVMIHCHFCGIEVYKKSSDLLKSKSKKYFCSSACSNKWIGINKREGNHPNWVNGKSSYRETVRRDYGDKVCVFCAESNMLVLVVHHIDQNRDNNHIENLSWLCRNCHFLIHHYAVELEKFNRVIHYANQ